MYAGKAMMHVYRQIEARRKHYDRILLLFTGTYSVLLMDTAPPTFIQKPKRKDPLTDKGVRLDLLGLYDTGPGRPNGSHETVAGYLHPRGASMVGELSPALSSRARLDPWTTAHNPHDSAPRGKAPGARTPQSSSNHRTRRARYQPKRRPPNRRHEAPP